MTRQRLLLLRLHCHLTPTARLVTIASLAARFHHCRPPPPRQATVAVMINTLAVVAVRPHDWRPTLRQAAVALPIVIPRLTPRPHPCRPPWGGSRRRGLLMQRMHP